MDAKEIQEIQSKFANRIVNACGKTGVLESVSNDRLKGDVKIRHRNAMKECEQFKDKDGHVDPNIQAIFARMYGLI